MPTKSASAQKGRAYAAYRNPSWFLFAVGNHGQIPTQNRRPSRSTQARGAPPSLT